MIPIGRVCFFRIMINNINISVFLVVYDTNECFRNKVLRPIDLFQHKMGERIEGSRKLHNEKLHKLH